MCVFLVILFVSVVSACNQLENYDAFKDELQEVKRMLQKQNSIILNQGNEIESLKTKCSVHEKENIERGRRQLEGFAFTAYHDREEHVHAGNPLKFSKLLFNLGTLYDPTTGVATIQEPGVYLFTVTIEHWTTIELRCYLVVDGINQVDVIIYPQGRSTQASNTAILGLQQGQRVWVKTDEGTVYGSDGFRGTTFSGIMIA